MLRRAAAGARSLLSLATASNFVNPSAYPRCGSPRSNWLENSYLRTLWKSDTMLTLEFAREAYSRSESSILPVQVTLRYRKAVPISTSTVISVALTLVSGFEVSRRATPAHSPHGGEIGRE